MRYRISKLEDRYIDDYAKAVVSDWYNEFQAVKYNKRQTMEDLKKRIKQFSTGRMVIVDSNDKLVGGISVLVDGDETSIGYFILPEYQGRGIAKSALALATQKMKDIDVCLYIMDGNKASGSVARACGYVEVSRENGIIKYMKGRN